MHSTYETIPGNRTDDNKKQDRNIRILALSLASMFLSLALVVFHAFASMEVIKYGNEVLYDKDDDFNSNGDNAFGNATITVYHGSDDQCLPIVYVVISFLPTVSLIIVILLNLFVIIKHYRENADNTISSIGLFLQVSLGVFLVYLAFYFLPYMLLAFINDPIKALFIYIMIALYILSFYLLTYSLCFLIDLSLHQLTEKKILIKIILIVPSTISCLIRHPYFTGSGASIAYFVTILIFLLRLGNFNDFQAAHNLTLPVIVIVFSVFVLKPFYKYIFKPSEEDDVTKLTNKMQALIQKIDPLVTQIENAQGRDHNPIQ